MKTPDGILDYRLDIFFTYAGGCICILISLACLSLACLLSKRHPYLLGGYFAINVSLLILAMVMVLKGAERFTYGDLVTIVDICRDAAILAVTTGWLIVEYKGKNGGGTDA